jgi:outer membrane protein assembly factor BamD
MPRLPGLSRLLVLLVLVSMASGCASMRGWFSKEDRLETQPVEAMYDEGNRTLLAGNYSRAERVYTRLIARFPFGEYTEQAQLELAYAQYKASKYEEATATIDRFIRTYPAHQHIDYAYYLKALVNFSRSNSTLDRIARLDGAQRDQSTPRQSFNDFGVLLQRYPNSRYAADARQRMVFLRNLLARHEVGVGQYYLRRGAYVAAANRGKFLLQTYPQSEHDGDALALMAASYAALGQEQLAADTRKVLEANHPDHPYLTEGASWPRDGGFISLINPFD